MAAQSSAPEPMGVFYTTYKRLISIYILVIACLPSAMLFNFPLKHLLFVMLLLASLPILLTQPLRNQGRTLLILVVLLVWLVIYMLVGLHHGYPIKDVGGEFTAIVIFLITFYFIAIAQTFTNTRALLITILTYALIGNILFMLIKAAIFLILLTNIMTYHQVADTFFIWLNYTPVGLALETGGSRLSYITMDLLSLILFTFYWIYRTQLPKWMQPPIFMMLYTLLFLIALYAAYSRALMLLFPVFFVFVLLLKKQYKVLILMMLIGLLALWSLQDIVQQVIQQRFLNQEHSDNWRLHMLQDIWRHFTQAPIIGWGLGAHLPEFIRDPERPYSYEVQLFSMFFKLGLLFPLTLLALLTWMLLKTNTLEKLLALLVFVVWMLLSMTNQYLFNTTTAVIGAILYLIYQQATPSHDHH